MAMLDDIIAGIKPNTPMEYDKPYFGSMFQCEILAEKVVEKLNFSHDLYNLSKRSKAKAGNRFADAQQERMRNELRSLIQIALKERCDTAERQNWR